MSEDGFFVLQIYILNLAVYVAKNSDDISVLDLDAHFDKFLSSTTGLEDAIEELNNHKSFSFPLKDGYSIYYVYYLNSAVKDLNTGDIYASEFYAAAPFDNDFAFDNLIANSKLFNK